MSVTQKTLKHLFFTGLLSISYGKHNQTTVTGDNKPRLSVTELQSSAEGVKTRLGSCERTPDTRREQMACEQLGVMSANQTLSDNPVVCSQQFFRCYVGPQSAVYAQN